MLVSGAGPVTWLYIYMYVYIPFQIPFFIGDYKILSIALCAILSIGYLFYP